MKKSEKMRGLRGIAFLAALVLAVTGLAVPARAAVSKKLTVVAGEKGSLELPQEFTLTTDRILSAAKARADYVRENGFQYGDARKNPAFDDSEGLVSCDRYVQWVLHDLGFTDLPEASGLVVWRPGTEYDFTSWCEKHNFTKITKKSKLKAGDLVFLGKNKTPGHIYLLGNKIADGQWERYDCGARPDTGNISWRLQQVQPFVEPIDYAPNNPFCYAYRPVTPKVTWSSSDKSIATVSAKGAVTGVSQGTCKVTAKSDIAKPTTYTITVLPSDQKPGKPSFTPSRNVSRKAKTFTVTTSTVSGADGFEIRYSLKKSLKGYATKTVKAARKANRVVVNTNKSGKTYYIKVRAYKSLDGQKLYGPWSDVKSIKSR